MVDIFIEFISAAMNVGSITAASMYPNLITIDGTANDGRKYSVSFRFAEENNQNADNP